MRSRKEPAAGRDKVNWPSAQTEPERSEAKPWVQRHVSRVFLKDDEADAISRRLSEEITLGDKRTDYGSVVRALDRAEENQRLAYSFLVTIKSERDRFDLGNEPIIAAMRQEALQHLENEKAGKVEGVVRTKQITDADVTAKIAAVFRDEWQDIADESRRLELAVRHAEHNVSVWSDRSRSLNTLANKLR
jgi:hypothetical protein